MCTSKSEVRDTGKTEQSMGLMKTYFASQFAPLVYLNGHLLQVSIVTSGKGRGRNKWRVTENVILISKNNLNFLPLPPPSSPEFPGTLVGRDRDLPRGQDEGKGTEVSFEAPSPLVHRL